MKKITIARVALILAISLTTNSIAFSQKAYESTTLNISLKGTSSLHDWEMKAANGNSEATFSTDSKGVITQLSKLNFSLAAKSLKSAHKVMDNNTYKALKADKNPTISFVMTSGTVTPEGGNNYVINCKGKLSIAGTTKDTDLVAAGKYNPSDKSFTVTGIKKMKMTDYNVTPPKAMMGTIKTGNDISISYNIKFVK